jgi:predicted DNA-binding transcriptional regulator AlpA
MTLKPAPMLSSERVPKVCTVSDVCRALNISERRFYELRAEKTFPIPEILPRLTRGPRFRGTDVELYIEGAFAPRRQRAGLRSVEAAQGSGEAIRDRSLVGGVKQ